MLAVKRVLLKDENTVFAYLFGSMAKGTAHRFSDMDIAVYLKDPSTASYLKLLGKLPTRTRRELDVVLLNTAPPSSAIRSSRRGSCSSPKTGER